MPHMEALEGTQRERWGWSEGGRVSGWASRLVGNSRVEV